MSPAHWTTKQFVKHSDKKNWPKYRYLKETQRNTSEVTWCFECLHCGLFLRWCLICVTKNRGRRERGREGDRMEEKKERKEGGIERESERENQKLIHSKLLKIITTVSIDGYWNLIPATTNLPLHILFPGRMHFRRPSGQPLELLPSPFSTYFSWTIRTPPHTPATSPLLAQPFWQKAKPLAPAPGSHRKPTSSIPEISLNFTEHSSFLNL